MAENAPENMGPHAGGVRNQETRAHPHAAPDALRVATAESASPVQAAKRDVGRDGHHHNRTAPALPFDSHHRAELAESLRESTEHAAGGDTHEDPTSTLVGPPLTDRAIERERERAEDDTLIHDDLVSQDLAWQRNVQKGFKELGDIKVEVGKEHPSPLHRLADYAKRVYHIPRDMRAARASQQERDERLNMYAYLTDETLDRHVRNPELRQQILRETEARSNQRETAAAADRYRRENMTPIGRWMDNIASRLRLRPNDLSVGVDTAGALHEDSVLSILQENPQEVTSVSAEAARPQGILPLQPNVISSAVELAKNYPSIYESEWRYMAGNGKGAMDKPLTLFLFAHIGAKEGSVYVPITGNQANDNYIRGALIMHSMLRWQAKESHIALPLITENTVDQLNEEKREHTLADPPQAWPLVISELKELTGGEVNRDMTSGAADVYNLVKLALENRGEHPVENSQVPEQPAQDVDAAQRATSGFLNFARRARRGEPGSRAGAQHRRSSTVQLDEREGSHSHRAGSRPERHTPRHTQGRIRSRRRNSSREN